MHLCPTQLRSHYRDHRVLPFVGAGASMSVRWKENHQQERRGPSWDELVDQAARLLGFEEPELARVRGTPLQILEYFKLKNADQTAKLTNWFARNMRPPDVALKTSIIHTELVGLFNCPRFYTTNYDDFLERAFQLGGRPCKVVAVEQEMGGQGECEIVKFHGDLDHPDQIVLTESDYEKRLALTTALDQRLRADLLGRVVLFIGYSFRDPNVSYLFRLFTNEFLNRPGALKGPRGYIIVADPSDFEMTLFQAREMEVIPISGMNKERDIADLFREMRT